MRNLMYTPHLKQKAEQHRGTPKREYLACGSHLDLRLITLRSHYIDEIYDIAFNTANGNLCEVHSIANSLMKTNTLKVREFVEVMKDEILIVLDVDKIDKEAEDRALMLLIEVEEIKYGVKRYFGDPISFK